MPPTSGMAVCVKCRTVEGGDRRGDVRVGAGASSARPVGRTTSAGPWSSQLQPPEQGSWMTQRWPVLTLLEAGISITLLVDLAEQSGPDSAEIFTVETHSD